MNITLERVNQAVHLVARNEEGAEVHLDGSPAIGGQGLGMRPMEMVLSSLAGCSAMDVVSMVQKQGMDLKTFRMDINGTRAEKKVPQVFTDIDLHFILGGNLVEEKVAEAIELSMTRFCSVAAMLKPTVSITWHYTLEA